MSKKTLRQVGLNFLCTFWETNSERSAIVLVSGSIQSSSFLYLTFIFSLFCCCFRAFCCCFVVVLWLCCCVSSSSDYIRFLTSAFWSTYVVTSNADWRENVTSILETPRTAKTKWRHRWLSFLHKGKTFFLSVPWSHHFNWITIVKRSHCRWPRTIYCV